MAGADFHKIQRNLIKLGFNALNVETVVILLKNVHNSG